MSTAKQNLIRNLDHYLRQRPAVAPEDLVSEWQEAVGRLMDDVRAWVAEVNEGSGTPALTVTETEFEIEEYALPAYTVGGLIIQGPLPKQKIVLRPVARMMVGAQGRVDMRAGGYSVMLLRQHGGAWGVSIPNASTAMVEFTQDLFYDQLTSLFSAMAG